MIFFSAAVMSLNRYDTASHEALYATPTAGLPGVPGGFYNGSRCTLRKYLFGNKCAKNLTFKILSHYEDTQYSILAGDL